MKKYFTIIIILLLFSPIFKLDATPSGDKVKVVRVVDGDTIVVKFKNGRYEKVRLIGINTPETVDPRRPVQYFGKEASRYTKKHLLGKTVFLQYDWQLRDKYGRLLAYVFLPDGTFFNAKIIRDGYAFAFTRYPFQYMKLFRKLEREAREAGLGLWNPASPYVKEREKRYHRWREYPFKIIKGEYVASKWGKYFYSPRCREARRIKPKNRVWFNSWAEAEKAGYKPHRCLKKLKK